jgi:hypothetical protein
VDQIKKHLPLQNNVSLSFDTLTSTNNFSDCVPLHNIQIKIGSGVLYISPTLMLIASCFLLLQCNYGRHVKDRHITAILTKHLMDVLDHYQLTDCHSPAIATGNAFSNYSMTHELHSTLEDSRMLCTGLIKHIPCMAHILQLPDCSFSFSLGAMGNNKSLEAHDRNQHFG